MSKPTPTSTQIQTTKADDKEKAVEFVPFGASDKVRLTASMVRSFISIPTASGAVPSERDCIRFIMLCRGKRANPFEGDVFMIGYDNWRDGRMTGATFSMVCGVELFLKRAEQSDKYDGRESGVIVQSGDTITERPGTLVLKGETLVGGWAKVHRKDRNMPEYKAVDFTVYDTGKSRWKKDPGGMIEKVALSQALRSAFPTALGGLYTQEEMTKLTETGEGILVDRAQIEMPKALAREATPATEQEPPPQGEPQPPEEPQLTPQQRLAGELEKAKVSFDDARDFIQVKGLVADSSGFASVEEIPVAVCAKLLSDTKLMAELAKKFGKK